jgi:flagellar biosynthesis protein FliQ
MTPADVAAVLREGLLVALKLTGPLLAVGAGVGVLVALLQAITQLQEATLAFIPKAVALALTLSLTGSFMLGALNGYAHRLMDRIVAIGGS